MTDFWICDYSGSIGSWIFGDENCLTIFGYTIKELGKLKEENIAQFNEICKSTVNEEVFLHITVRLNDFTAAGKLFIEIANVSKIDEMSNVLDNLIENRFCAFKNTVIWYGAKSSSRKRLNN